MKFDLFYFEICLHIARRKVVSWELTRNFSCKDGPFIKRKHIVTGKGISKLPSEPVFRVIISQNVIRLRW